MAKSEKGDPWEYGLRKYLLLLATLVATVTYSAGFNPPGGVWQDNDPAAGHIGGDPIIRETSRTRYLAFFYCNATAFASSLVVIVLILILSVLHDEGQGEGNPPGPTPLHLHLHALRAVMVLDLLSLMGAYAAGTCRDALTTAYSVALVVGVAAYVAVKLAAASWSERKDNTDLDKLRKVLMLLATFAVSLTYLAGLTAPGGFWDHDEGAGRPGDAVLKGGRHDARLKAFFVCNTTAFATSLLVIVLLLDKKLSRGSTWRYVELYGFILVTLAGLMGAYSAGSCRQVDTTVYVNALIGAVIVAISVLYYCGSAMTDSWLWKKLGEMCQSVSDWWRDSRPSCLGGGNGTGNGNGSDGRTQALRQARSLVLLLATLAAAITYQAGLNPPGGIWPDDLNGHMAGDPILLTRSPRRYKAFFYCNSVAFVASLVAVVLVPMQSLHRHNALEAAMILGLFGLIGAYAAGSCRDVHTSVNAVALAGAVLVYVVIHVVFFTLDHDDVETRAHDAEFLRRLRDQNAVLEKRRKRLLLFAILAATITYQAGLTPPSGFRLEDDDRGHRAGDPVLLYNFPRRYRTFFYCNSVSFMLSIALIILLVNKNLYRPAIRSSALSICTAAGMFGLVGAYAAGSTQHIKTSIYIFVLAGVILACVAVLVLVFLIAEKKKKEKEKATPGQSATATSTSVPAAWPSMLPFWCFCRASVPAADAATEQSSATRTAIEMTEKRSTVSSQGNADSESAAVPGDGGAGTGDDEEAEKKIHPKRKCLMLLGILVASVGGAGTGDDEEADKKNHPKRKYLMLLGILVASVTYQAGLAPPGGVWNGNIEGHAAGNPIMHDNRYARYIAFFYSNSTSFVASVVVIILLLPESLHKSKWWLTVMNCTLVLDLLGLLIAYAAGSSRSWKTSGYVTALVIAVLGYFVIHVVLSCFSRYCNRSRSSSEGSSSRLPNGNGTADVEAQAQPAPAPAQP